MKLQSLHIKNFKSIVDLEIVEPNPFTVFVGPNGSGKSNIFEALEFVSFNLPFNKYRLFGGNESLNNRSIKLEGRYELIINSLEGRLEEYGNYMTRDEIDNNKFHLTLKGVTPTEEELKKNQEFTNKFMRVFNRIFIGKRHLIKLNYEDSLKLNIATSNLEKVLKRILLDENKREEIKEWLDLFIPGFENIEIVSSDLGGTDTLVMYEKGMKKPFTKDLLSDGTYNILALLTAVYQSDEPQFLCIEEPENGLHPKVIRELVHFFREACETKGHYIWLNTHSQTLVSELTPEEIILVNKKKGETVIKQLKNQNLHGLRMDEAWLTAALGGGLPW